MFVWYLPVDYCWWCFTFCLHRTSLFPSSFLDTFYIRVRHSFVFCSCLEKFSLVFYLASVRFISDLSSLFWTFRNMLLTSNLRVENLLSWNKSFDFNSTFHVLSLRNYILLSTWCCFNNILMSVSVPGLTFAYQKEINDPD